MKLTYKLKILVYFLLIFILFTLSIIVLEQKQEEKYRTEALESELDNYAFLIYNYLDVKRIENLNVDKINSLKNLIKALPEEIRITLINNDGRVFYDKDVPNISTMENHAKRPEIRNALFNKFGTDIRLSVSTNHKYLYYARHYPNYYVRVALPYNIKTKNLLQADHNFIYIVSGLFIIVFLSVYYVATRFAQSISQIKQFTIDIKEDRIPPENIKFPNDELGDIGNELVEIFKQKEKGKHILEAEKEKLIQHFQFSEEGLGIFNSKLEKQYINTHFIQYLNFIINSPTLQAEEIFKEEIFSPISDFILKPEKYTNNFTMNLNTNGKIFMIKVIIFEDKSFQLTIKDITKIEKNRILKQEMTSNIAHELRTPVTSLRGYLEILNDQKLSFEKQAHFIEKAYFQSIRLSNLIEDVSLISRIEESESKFTFEKINLHLLVDEIRIGLIEKLSEKQIKFYSYLEENLEINGNKILISSVFHNLIENTINYAGSNIEIHINNYMDDENYLYFSYYDTGVGVTAQYLPRLFERFYRVNEGRTRNTGGSGLGLSIVRNVITLHEGEIQAKIHKKGGLEFLFSLKK